MQCLVAFTIDKWNVFEFWRKTFYVVIPLLFFFILFYAGYNKTCGKPHKENRPYPNIIWKSCTKWFRSKNHWKRGALFLWYYFMFYFWSVILEVVCYIIQVYCLVCKIIYHKNALQALRLSLKERNLWSQLSQRILWVLRYVF